MNLQSCSDLGRNPLSPSGSTRPFVISEVGITQANSLSSLFHQMNKPPAPSTLDSTDSSCLSMNSSISEAHRQVILKAMKLNSFGSSIPPLLLQEPVDFSETKFQSPGSVEAYRLRLRDGGVIKQPSLFNGCLFKNSPASIQFSDLPIAHRAGALQNLSPDISSESNAHDGSSHIRRPFNIQQESLKQLPSGNIGNEQTKRFKRTLQELERELLSDDSDLPCFIDHNEQIDRSSIQCSAETRDWAEVIQDLQFQDVSLPSQTPDLLHVREQQIFSCSSRISNSQSKSSLASEVTSEVNASCHTSPFSQQRLPERLPQGLEVTSTPVYRKSMSQQQTSKHRSLQGNSDTTGQPKQLLISCASAIAENDFVLARSIVISLKRVASTYGDPLQRLAAYMTDALVSKLESSYQHVPTPVTIKECDASEVVRAIEVFHQVCPYSQFGYIAANSAIIDATKGEENVHIIDFKIGEGKQWVALIRDLAVRPGGPPKVRLTGVDEPQWNASSPGGLECVGKLLGDLAHSVGVPFEFHPIAKKVSEIESSMLQNRKGEVLAVNFAFQLHQMADESVCITNPRDRLLRMVRTLNPKIVTMVEFEANTNTAPFYLRFLEALGFYTAIFESLDASLPRESRERVNVERNCLAKDIMNVISCEGTDRIQRYEVAGKWRVRMIMAGFRPYPFSTFSAARSLLENYSKNYRLKEEGDTLQLGWLERVLIVASFWQ